jgi:hypothetical protein
MYSITNNWFGLVGWVETICFGVFVEAGLMLNTANIEWMIVGSRCKKLLRNLK